MMKPPYEINYVLVEGNYFLKSPTNRKICQIMICILEKIYDSEEIIKCSMFRWIFFVVQKLLISCMIAFYVYTQLSFFGYPNQYSIYLYAILHQDNLKQYSLNSFLPKVFTLFLYTDYIKL